MDRDAILAVYAQGPEAVVALVAALIARYERAETELAALRARVQVLEDRLAIDSHTSHQPPSRDLSPRPKSLRQPSERPPGGQPGHRGTTLAWSATPDTVVLHQPATCAACGAALTTTDVVGTTRRQVRDLPELRLVTTEHIVEQRQCAVCGHLTRGHFPPEAIAPVRYGPRLRGLASYLTQYQLLPYARTAELLRDLFGGSFAPGTLAAIVAECHAALAATETRIQQALQRAAVAHFDETGLRVAGRRPWLHVASTDRLTHNAVQPGRRADLLAASGVLGDFTGVAVHDGHSAYFTFGCAHALCNVHHLRELTFVAERLQQRWAAELKATLLQMKGLVDAAQAAGQTRLDPLQVAAVVVDYRTLVRQGLAANPPRAKPPTQPGPPKRSKAGNLAERLWRHDAAVLRFLDDVRVPFDNNQAERDIRMVKVQQKIAGCFRTTTGAEQFCRIRGYLSTARKQGHTPLAALEAVFAGTPLRLA
jgi:transposase